MKVMAVIQKQLIMMMKACKMLFYPPYNPFHLPLPHCPQLFQGVIVLLLTENGTMPQENKDLCQVYYASVDHADAFHACETAQSLLLGQDFSGYSSSGQRVMGLVFSGALATHVEATSGLLWHVPDCWSLAQAASVPTAYITSFYALLLRGRVMPGEWVLIHTGASAVGQAAIAICLHTGCNVITTVLNEKEYRSVKSLFKHLSGLHVMQYSDMEDQVLALTGGCGVDVIFNTLHSSDWCHSLLHCLTRDGRFLDLAVPSFFKNKALGTLSLMNMTYHSIQLNLLFEIQNKDTQEVARLMKVGLESRVVTPLPAKMYLESEVEQAFRFVKNNKFTGKVLIEVCAERRNESKNPERRLVTAIPKLFVNPERVYILAGGLGGFGMEVAEFLVQRGARKLFLISRRGVTNGYKSMRIRCWRDAGVVVATSTQDITNEEGAATLLQMASMLGPIGGIFVLTVVLRDALLENQTKDNFQEVCKAKIDVTRSLDAVSQRLCPDLEYFVVFSSVVCGRGNPGQSPYGMANSSMERICEARHAMGLPALAIQWGPIGDVGIVFDTLGSEAVICQTETQCISSCIVALEKLMTQPHTIVTSHVLANRQLHSNSTSVREEEVLNTVLNILGVNDIAAGNLNMGADNFGIDSLISTEIKNTVEDEFKMTLTSQQIYNLMASTL